MVFGRCQNQFEWLEKTRRKVGSFGVRFIVLVIAFEKYDCLD
jgi:hypothetical protein